MCEVLGWISVVIFVCGFVYFGSRAIWIVVTDKGDNYEDYEKG